MLNELYEKIEAVLNHLDVGGEQSRAFAGEIELLKDVLGYPEPVQDDWDELDRCRILSEKLHRLAVAAQGILIPLPANPIGQWFDGTYQDTTIDMQFEEVDLGKLLKFIINVGMDQKTVIKREPVRIMLLEQSSDHPEKSIELSLNIENGQLWIRPVGYGEKCAPDGEGSPIGFEIWQGRLRLVVFDNIKSEDPQIIDLEDARESNRDVH
jgi:hypothetical protein